MIKSIFKRTTVSFISLLITVLFFSCTFIQETKTGKITFSTSSLLQNSSRAALNISNSDYIEISIFGDYTETKTVGIKEDSTIIFEEVPIDASVYAEVFIYRISAVGNRYDTYSGKSEKIVIKEGDNILTVLLKPIAVEDKTASYTVIHKFQNIDDDNYTDETETIKGKVSDFTAAKAKVRTGFTAKSFEQKEILEDNSTSIEIYYERNLHTVTYIGGFDDVTGIPEAKQYRYGATFTIEAEPERAGYVFGGWTTSDKDGNDIIYKTGEKIIIEDYDIILTANWSNSKETKYKVIHYQQNINDDEYTEFEIENKTGVTSELTNAQAKTYKGFTIRAAIAQEPISSDSSTVINIYYDRNTYTVAYEGGADSVTGVPTEKATYRYGAAITIELTEPTRTGYDFAGWKNAAGNIYKAGTPFEVGDSDIIFTAQWKSSTHTKYTVQHLLQNIDNDNYTSKETEELYGETLGQTNATAKSYKGFIAQTITQEEIAPDGSTVVAIKYNRKTFTITYEDGVEGEDISVPSDTTLYRYGATVSLNYTDIASRTGYTFAGWKDTTNGSIYKSDEVKEITIGEANVTLYAQWTANKYTITYNLNGGKWADGYTAPDSYTYGEQQNLPDADKVILPGYGLKGWFTANGTQLTETTTNMTGDIVLTAQWEAGLTNYTVRHWQQNIDDAGYTEMTGDQQILTGSSDSETSAKAKSYTGFTAKSFTQETISSDGKTIIDIYYDRNQHYIIYVAGADDETITLPASQLFRYGAKVSIDFSKAVRQGFDFAGWKDASGQLYEEGGTTSLTMGDNDITLTAQWTASTHTSYTVQHLLQNINDDNYTSKETEELYGETSAQTNAIAKSYEGFITPTVTQQEIKADGSTVIEIRYNRKNFTISYEDGVEGEEISVPSDTTLYRYGATVSLNYTDIASRTGYTFAGWKDTTNGIIYNSDEVIEITIGEANVTIYAQWTANKYKITYDLNGGEWADGYTAPESYTYGEQQNLPNADKVIRTGYGLKGWFTANGTQLTETTTNMTGDIVLTAQWEAGLTNYTVRHWQQNLADDGYTVMTGDEQVLSGKSESETTAKAKSYTGFTAKTITQKTIASDGSTKVDIYYDRNVHSINYAAGADDETISLPASQDFRYGATVNIDFSKVARQGFNFAGWKSGDKTYKEDGEISFIMGDSDVTLTAQWTASSHILYTVKHLQQNIDDDDYSEVKADKEEKYGTNLEQTNAEAKSYTGFTAQTITQETIKADGSTVVEIKYNRNIYSVSYESGADSVTGIPTDKETYRYGATITIATTEPTRTGFDFDGWKDAEGNVYTAGTKIEIGTTDITFTAQWKASAHTKYTVQHLLQNIDDDNYTSKETEVLYGETLAQTNATVKSYEGFISQTVTQQEINPDGSTVIIIKYNRKTFTISYEDGIEGEEITVPSDTTQYRYGANVVINYTDIAARTGYTFQGWKDKANDILYKSDEIKKITIGESNITLYAQWTANKYTINYELNGGAWEDGYTAPDSYTYGERQSLPNADKVIRTGYSLTGWYAPNGIKLTEIAAGTTGDIILSAQWAEGLSNYTVRHWQQNLANDEYTEITGDEQILTGTTNSETTAKAISYSGFTAKTFEQQTIESDESTIIDIYYDRILYSVVYAAGADDETISLPASQNFRYGANVSIDFSKAARQGFDFAGWKDANGNLYKEDGVTSFTLGDNDITLTAQWEPSTNTKYTVQHLLQNLADDDYTIEETEVLQGETLDQTSAKAKSYEGFTAQAVTQQEIKADGSTVITIKYNRKTATITYEDGVENEALTVPSDTTQYRYGANVVINYTDIAARTGYTFAGWKDTASGSIYKSDGTKEITMGEANITLTAQWTVENQNTGIDVNFGIDTETINVTISGTTATADTGYDTYLWIVDEETQTSKESTLDLSSFTIPGVYDITLKATKDGKTYTWAGHYVKN